MKKNSTIWVEQIRNPFDKNEYRVSKLTNRTSPKINTMLTTKEVDELNRDLMTKINIVSQK